MGFKSLCDDAIDTTTASGELVFNIFSSMVQFERRLIQEPTQAGLNATRARGRKVGGQKNQAAKRMHQDKSLAIEEICQVLKSPNLGCIGISQLNNLRNGNPPQNN